jgi:DNA-binding transcriptional LysR family regulator
LRSPENPIRKEVDYFLRSNAITPNIIAEVENPELILTMVLRGEGIGVLDPYIILKHEERGRVVKLHARPIGIRENLWLVCRQQAHGNTTVQAVIQSLMDGFRFSQVGLG